ncbi:hypothetical protein COMNV_01111 [Commensalibacter sp. Nvir]|nr:hypothetical protein COMNV_01111 [Commensalibacter sp. Nvir]
MYIPNNFVEDSVKVLKKSIQGRFISNKIYNFFNTDAQNTQSKIFSKKRQFNKINLSLDIIDYPPLFPKLSFLFRKIRAIRKIASILAWTIMAMPVQIVLLKLPGKGKKTFVCFFWRNVCRLLGVKLTFYGTILSTCSQQSTLQNRPVLYVVNHTSWLDIPTIGGLATGCFVAKEEVGTWPLISILCKLGRVIFVSRQKKSTAKEHLIMTQRLQNGDSLILFPEGTSSNGSHLLPFMSSFFVLAKPLKKNMSTYPTPIIQPISIVYDRLGMLPVNRLQRPVCSWYGDMELAPHLWEFCQWSDLHASIVFHDPLYPEHFTNRKELAQKTWEVIAHGTSTLRQRRPDKLTEKLTKNIH